MNKHECMNEYISFKQIQVYTRQTKHINMTSMGEFPASPATKTGVLHTNQVIQQSSTGN